MKNDYVIMGDEVLIRANAGRTILIDLEDLPTAQQIPGKWSASIDGRAMYALGKTVEGKRVKLHRLIMSAMRGDLVDHKDHDGLNNRRSNLRLVTPSQNQQNRPGANRNSKSGIRGVYFHPQRGKWIATCRGVLERKLIWLGTFETAAEAEAAAIAGRLQYMTHSDGGVLVGA